MNNLTIVATASFPTGSVPQMIATFGTAYGYSPSPTQTTLQGTPLYQTTNPSIGSVVSPGIVMYQFLIPIGLTAPLALGEMLLTNLNANTVYAVGSLSKLLYRVTGEAIEVTVFFNVSTTPVSVFGYTNNTSSTVLIPFVGSLNNLTPVDFNPSAGNTFLVQNPVNVADSMLAYAYYRQASISYDFDSWSFEEYILVGAGVTTGTNGGSVTLGITLVPQSFSGQYIFETAGYCQIASSVNIVGGVTNVTLNSQALGATPSGTPYKIFQYIGVTSAAASFIAQLTVSPAQINAIAALNPAKVFLADGSVAMTGPIQMGLNPIIDLADAANPKDSVNLETLTSSTGVDETELQALSNSVASLTAITESLQASTATLLTALNQLTSRVVALGG